MTIDPQPSQPAPASPYELRVRRRVWIEVVVSALLLLACYLWMGLVPVWTTWLHGRVFALSFVNLRNLAIFFLMISFFFVPALYIGMLASWSGSVQREQPYQWTFTAQEIAYRLPLGPWQRLPARTLTHIYLKPVPLSVRVRYKGAPGGKSWFIYHLGLRFSDGRTLEIGHDRAKQFGASVLQVHATLRALYPFASTQVPEGALAAERPDPAPALPLMLQLPPLTFWNGVLGTAFFVACAVVTVGIAFVLVLSKDQGPNSTFFLAGGLFGTVFLGMAALTFSSAFHPRQPYQLFLQADKVWSRRLLGGWQDWPVRDLQDIQLQPVKVTLYKRVPGGARRPSSAIWYNVVLVFSGGRALTLGQERILQFGFTPAQLHALLRGLYGF